MMYYVLSTEFLDFHDNYSQCLMIVNNQQLQSRQSVFPSYFFLKFFYYQSVIIVCQNSRPLKCKTTTEKNSDSDSVQETVSYKTPILGVRSSSEEEPRERNVVQNTDTVTSSLRTMHYCETACNFV